MKAKNDDPLLTKDLRRMLKAIVQDELERLPEILQGLEPKDRINQLCKIMPYVFPKVDKVISNEGEPLSFDC